MPHIPNSRPIPHSDALAVYKKARRLLDSIYQALRPDGPDNLDHVYGLLCESIMFFTRTYQIDGTWLASLNGRAEAYCLMSRLMPSEKKDCLERALSDYTEVINALHGIDKQPQESYYQDTKQWLLDAYLGRVYLVKQTHFKQAIEDLNECIRLSPRARFWLMKAEIQFMNGHAQSALESWLEAMRLYMKVESPFSKDYLSLYRRIKEIPESHSSDEAVSLQLALIQEFWSGTNCWNR